MKTPLSDLQNILQPEYPSFTFKLSSGDNGVWFLDIEPDQYTLVVAQWSFVEKKFWISSCAVTVGLVDKLAASFICPDAIVNTINEAVAKIRKLLDMKKWKRAGEILRPFSVTTPLPFRRPST